MYAQLETIFLDFFRIFFFFFYVVPFQNGGRVTDFYFASFRFLLKFEKKNKNKKQKTHSFPKEFFNEIWLKVGEHK